MTKAFLTLNLAKINQEPDVLDIIRAFRQVVVEGRTLNCTNEATDDYEGDTYDIMISRSDIFNSMVDEFSAPTHNARLPLKVDFMGDRGHDLGGPERSSCASPWHKYLNGLHPVQTTPENLIAPMYPPLS
ncbi:uncharacterized protein LOC110986561 [Acanthaster planci]|uniref:Uncharacterized protein LOC110986561 n=1 Tax=Acanthaster planci TaxID=133434 RepID=A0A8B7ZF01_ACAPL|nr:uncharacterized protein LOC110986561 [Acanthaster planci]